MKKYKTAIILITVFEADELLLGVACEMRREQVHPMWQVS